MEPRSAARAPDGFAAGRAGRPPAGSIEPLLLALGLGYRHRDGTRALDGVELAAAPGELLGLLGPNGSGKTTLLRLLAGVERPVEGALVRAPGARRTAVVFDRTPYPDPLPGRVAMERLLRLRAGTQAPIRERADRWLGRFGLQEAADRRVGAYSLGMRRKLSLAEAFAAEPDLLLLDEPLLGLDVPAREGLASALREAAGRGAAAVLALHDADFAEKTCGRVLFLAQGRVVARGTPAELVRALGRETVFEVRVDGGPARPGTPPGSLRWLGRSGESIRVATPEGSRVLPTLAGWLVDAGFRVRALSVREPSLEDAYLALTGCDLQGGELCVGGVR